jgi:TetR/AcrR family transcriptional regulator, transcriptional repressor for nem operon
MEDRWLWCAGMSGAADTVEAEPARNGKRERLVLAACDLLYRQGLQRTTLADIADAAGVPLGNVYYYFKAKDDIVAAVVHTHVEQLGSGLAAVERRHRSPKARLKALVDMVADQGATITRYGCPYGTLSSELTKRSDGSSRALAAQLMETLVGWVQAQFVALGRRDARELAIELVVAYQGAAIVGSALGEPQVIARRASRVKKWIDSLHAGTDRAPQHGGHGQKGVTP